MPLSDSRRRRIAKVLLANLCVWLVLELVSFVILAAIERGEGGHEQGGEPNDKDWLVQARMSFEGGLYVWDEYCLWRLQPDYRGGEHGGRRFWGDGPLVLNAHGMRSPSVPIAKPPGKKRLLILGGSHPMGMYVNVADTYGARLAARLGPEWELLNAAAPGHTSYQGRQYLAHYGLEFAPDLVVVDLGVNDTLPLTPDFPLPDHEVKRPPTWVVDARSALRISAVYRLLRRVLRTRQPVSAAGQRVPADEHEKNLLAIQALGKERGFRVLLVNQFRADLYGAGHIQCLFEERGLDPVVDACSMWRRHGDVRSFFHDPVHANARGHAMLADLIFDRLVALGWAQKKL